MARFEEKEIEAIKQNVSLLRLAESQGHELKREGNDYVMCCPFHEESTASMKITPDKNLFNCFGCGAGGSVIDWTMKTQGVSFRHAVELLKSDFSLAADTAVVKQATVPKLESPLSENADAQGALEQVIDYYHQTLKDSPEAKAYLSQRGLDDVELIDYFKLGYANRTLGLRLPHKNRIAGAAIRETLQQVGIYRQSGHEHFNGSLVVPVVQDGQITEVYGRKLLGNKLRKGTPQHMYLPGAHAGVFNADALQGGSRVAGGQESGATKLQGASEVILCESLIDAMTFWRHGFHHVTSSYGTQGFTDELLAFFIAQGVQRVLIAYDRDDAGNAAAEKIAKALNKNNIDAYRIQFPNGMDANEYALSAAPAQKSLGLAIRKAEPMGKISHVAASSSLAADAAKETLEVESSPVPKVSTPTVPMEIKGSEIYLTLGNRMYRVKGIDPENPSTNADSLKINLMVSVGEAFHMDKLDLYSSKQRQVFINQSSVECSVELDVIKRDLGKVLLQLESLQQPKPALEKKVDSSLSAFDKDKALALLRSPDLLSRILLDFDAAGVVGEDTNKLVGYLACVSRKLDRPLAVMVQSSSAAGKSSLMDAILNLIPEAERMQYSAMTGQSLFYMGEKNLKHKILAITEEEGAHNASYALKLLQSEGEVTIASTGKDDNTGDLVTKEYRVEGPVMLFMTTTAIDIDEELLNRCLVLSVNESREQTQAIHAAQRKKRTLAGLQGKLKHQQLTQLHRDAQSLLKPLYVINPYADQLTFLDDKTRTRRDHEKYLTLIDSIALLHQYQREIKTVQHADRLVEYIEVSLEDIDVANRLANEVLGKTLDELPPQTRKLLSIITGLIERECKEQSIEQKDYRLSRRAVRQQCGWSETQVRVHIQRLVDMEYLLSHRGGRGQSFEYELLYQGEGDSGSQFLMGLLDVEQLKKHRQDDATTSSSRGYPHSFAEPSRPQNGDNADRLETVPSSNHKAYTESSRLGGEKIIQAV